MSRSNLGCGWGPYIVAKQNPGNLTPMSGSTFMILSIVFRYESTGYAASDKKWKELPIFIVVLKNI